VGRGSVLVDLAAVAFVATTAVAGASLTLSGSGSATPLEAVGFGLVVLWGGAGVVVGRRSGERRLGGLFSVAALVGSIALAASRLAVRGSSSQRRVAEALASVALPLLIAATVQVMLSLPAGNLTSSARRIVTGVGYGLAVIAGVEAVVVGRSYGPISLTACWAATVLCVLPSVWRRYRWMLPRERDRLRWMTIGAVVAFDGVIVATVLHLLVGWPASLGVVAAGITAALPVTVMAGYVPALARRGGRALVQVLAIAGFTLVVCAIYLVVVFGLAGSPTGTGDREVLGVSMVAAAVAAIGYVPARARLLGVATHLVYGKRQPPDEVLRTFGSKLKRSISLDELLLQLAESLRASMALSGAAIYTGSGEILHQVVSVPDTGPRSIVLTSRERPVLSRAGVSGNAWAGMWLPALLEQRGTAQLRVVPVSHAGELLGLIVVERASAADPFSDADDRVLDDLAREVALALHNAQLDNALQSTLDELRAQAETLRESRARIVASGDEERRRVERNLHDGAQQHLVALAINLRLARDMVDDDVAAAMEMLDQLSVEVGETIRELRELAHGIYPPLLVDGGLAAALRATIRRNPLPVEVIADGICRYRPEVEAAVYFCCLEALQNAAKHAPDATGVVVKLWEERDELLFSVTDDGPGFDVQRAHQGHGFVNMSDRLGAIGGRVSWESAPGHGAQVRGSVPRM
jgi:signal transduction histidine kinase